MYMIMYCSCNIHVHTGTCIYMCYTFTVLCTMNDNGSCIIIIRHNDKNAAYVHM